MAGPRGQVRPVLPSRRVPPIGPPPLAARAHRLRALPHALLPIAREPHGPGTGERCVYIMEEIIRREEVEFLLEWNFVSEHFFRNCFFLFLSSNFLPIPAL